MNAAVAKEKSEAVADAMGKAGVKANKFVHPTNILLTTSSRETLDLYVSGATYLWNYIIGKTRPAISEMLAADNKKVSTQVLVERFTGRFSDMAAQAYEEIIKGHDPEKRIARKLSEVNQECSEVIRELPISIAFQRIMDLRDAAVRCRETRDMTPEKPFFPPSYKTIFSTQSVQFTPDYWKLTTKGILIGNSEASTGRFKTAIFNIDNPELPKAVDELIKCSPLGTQINVSITRHPQIKMVDGDRVIVGHNYTLSLRTTS